MLATLPPEYGWSLVTATGRPAAAWGTSVTPGNNTYGSYAELIDGALVTQDVWWIDILISSGATAAAARDLIVTIGIDPSAGTSYVDTINHLLGSGAAAYDVYSGGVWYGFPLRIPAGSSIAAKASVNNATVGTVRVTARLYGLPRHPEVTPLGSFVRSFGVTLGSSSGTTVTPGTTSEGSYAQLGTATAEPLWYWEWGVGVSDSTMSSVVHHCDLACGDATNKRLIVLDGLVHFSSNEATSKQRHQGEFMRVATGDLIYGRMQCSGTVDSAISMMAYGVGG